VSDPTLARMAWSAAAFSDYAELAELLCHCEALCVCGWDEPGGPAEQMIEQRRLERRRPWETPGLSC
jgi:hypothetical protein